MDADTAKFLENAGMFRCIPLRATLSAATCARNFTGAACMACVDCPTGRQHADALSLGKQAEDAPTSCVRCGRSGRCRGERLVGRFRLVRGNTLCVSCYNREREFVRGRNAKGAPPVKWSGLREAHVEIDLHGKQQRLDIGLRSGPPEIERFVARRWPEATITRVWLDPEPPRHVPIRRPPAASGASHALAAGF